MTSLPFPPLSPTLASQLSLGQATQGFASGLLHLLLPFPDSEHSAPNIQWLADVIHAGL